MSYSHPVRCSLQKMRIFLFDGSCCHPLQPAIEQQIKPFLRLKKRTHSLHTVACRTEGLVIYMSAKGEVET